MSQAVVQHVVLFAHGSRDPKWAIPLETVRQKLQEILPDRQVKLAFLEFMAPNLQACVADLVATGGEQIQLVPMFIAAGGHVLNDLPRQVGELEAQFPGLAINVGPVMGDVPSVQAAMADAVVHQLRKD